MTDLHITHDHADGTLLHGTTRGDGTDTLLKEHGWRWSRTITLWYLPRSRDRDANTATIDRTAAALQAEGFTVEVTIDNNGRDTAAVETDRIERQDQRTDRLDDRAQRLTDHAEQAAQAAHELADRIPFGQPILADHHSAGPMRRHYERITQTQRRAHEISQAAAQAATRAAIASRTTSTRYAPRVVANRIERIATEIRQLERQRDGYTRTYSVHSDGTKDQETFPAAQGAHRDQLVRQIESLEDQLRYWQNVRGDQLADGTATDYGPHNIRPGDHVRIGRTWYPVIRANPKSVSVPSGFGTGTNTTPYTGINEHRAAPTADTED